MDFKLTYLNIDEYSQLTFILGNRAVNPSYTKKLRLEIEHNNGQIPARKDWILIINDKNEVVDGQCRIEAVRQYNARHPKNTIPTIACTVEPGAGLKRAQAVNNANTKWKTSDYIYSNIKLGRMDYAFLQTILDNGLMNKAGGLKIALGVCMGFDTPALMSKFRKGEFKMLRTEADATELLNYLSDCRVRLNKSFGHYSYVAPVFFKCLFLRDRTHKDIDRERLKDKINHVDISWKGKVNGRKKNFMFSDDPVDILNNIHIAYNHGLTETNPRYFNIYGAYMDVGSYNFLHSRGSIMPKLRDSLRDNGVVPV